MKRLLRKCGEWKGMKKTNKKFVNGSLLVSIPIFFVNNIKFLHFVAMMLPICYCSIVDVMPDVKVVLVARIGIFWIARENVICVQHVNDHLSCRLDVRLYSIIP